MRTYSHRTRLIAAAAGMSIVLMGGHGTARADDAGSDGSPGTTSTSTSTTDSGDSTTSGDNSSGESGSGSSSSGSNSSGGDGSGGDGSGSGDSGGTDSGGSDSGSGNSGSSVPDSGGRGDSGGPGSQAGDGTTSGEDGQQGSGSGGSDNSGSGNSGSGTGDSAPADTGATNTAPDADTTETPQTPTIDPAAPQNPATVTVDGPSVPLWQPPVTGDTTGGTSDSGSGPSTDTSRSADDAPAPEDAGTDAPGTDVPGTDAPGTDAPGTDADGTGTHAGSIAPVTPLLLSAASVPTPPQSLSAPTSAPTAPAPASLDNSPLNSALGLLTLFGLPLLSGGNSPAPSNPIGWALLWIVRRHQEHWHNQAPVAAPTVTTSDPDTGVVTGNLNATDNEGDPITYQVTTGPTQGGVVVDADGTFTYTPGQDLLDNGGTDTFTVTTSDSTGGHHHHFAIPFWLGQTGHSTSTTVTVVVDAVNTNEAPTLTVNPPTTVDPITGIATGAITATDPDDDPLTYTVNGNTGTGNTFTTDKGTLTLNGDGTYTFTPTAAARWNASFAGEDPATHAETLSITVDDGNGGTATQAVTIGIATIAVPGEPVGQAATSSNGRTYFTTFDPGTGTTYVTYIDPVTRATTTTDVAGTPLGGIQVGPTGVAYQTSTNGSNRTYITSFGGPLTEVMEYFYDSPGHTPVGNLQFDAAGNAFQVISNGNNTAVYRIGADGLGKVNSILNEKPVGPVVIAPDGKVYLTTERLVSGSMKTRITLINSANDTVKTVNAAGVPAGTVYIGPDGSVYQVTYQAGSNETAVYRYTAALTNPDDFDVDGKPYGGAYFDDDGTIYILTMLHDGNTQISRINYDWGYAGYFDVEGTPVGDVVFLPGTNQGYFVTRTDGATPGSYVTHIHSVDFDAFPPSSTVDIPGEPVGGPVVADNGSLYQVITGPNTTIVELNGSDEYQINGTAAGPVISDGDLLFVTVYDGDQSTGQTFVYMINTSTTNKMHYSVDGTPVGEPVTGPGPGTAGTNYQTVLRHDAATDTYTTTVIVYHPDFVYHVTFDGRPTTGVHIAPDGTVTQTVETGGITREVVISGDRV